MEREVEVLFMDKLLKRSNLATLLILEKLNEVRGGNV
jgi:hypothetical protein